MMTKLGNTDGITKPHEIKWLSTFLSYFSERDIHLSWITYFTIEFRFHEWAGKYIHFSLKFIQGFYWLHVFVLTHWPPCDAIWHYGTGSSLIQVMAWWLMAQGHYLKQWWLANIESYLAFSNRHYPRKYSRCHSPQCGWKLLIWNRSY